MTVDRLIETTNTFVTWALHHYWHLPARSPSISSAPWSGAVFPPPISEHEPPERYSANCSRNAANGAPGSAAIAQPRLSRMLRLKSLRMSGFSALADARFAKAAMALTAGTEISAFMFMLVTQEWFSLAGPSKALRSEIALDQHRMTNLHRHSLQNSR